MKKIAIVFASAAMMLAGACTSKEPEKTVPQEAEQAQPATEVVATQGDGKVVELTDAKQYAPGVKVSQLTILDFNAVWCDCAASSLLYSTSLQANMQVVLHSCR